jgi:hypothetical protein
MLHKLKIHRVTIGVNQRKEEVRQEMRREQGLQVNKILIMKMILICHDIVIENADATFCKPCGI